MTTKHCTKCGTDKELSEFCKFKLSKDGLQSNCKSCMKAYATAYRKANPDRMKAASKKWAEANPDKVKAATKKWQQNNPDKVAAKSKKWQKANLDKVSAITAKRRASKLNATPAWLTPDQLSEIQQHYQVAKDLETMTGEVCHVDHIVPLQGENVCGLHVPWNLQVLTASDNMSKGNRYEEI